MLRTHPLPIALVCAAFLGAISHSAQAADSTPSDRTTIAALAKIGLDPSVADAVATLQAGLAHPNPSVRAAAARMSHTTTAVDLLSSLRNALDKETDATAAHELAWTLADLDETVASDEALLAALAKPGFTAGIAHALSAGRGLRLLPLWPQIKASVDTVANTFVRGFIDGNHFDAGTVIASVALRDNTANVFNAVTDSAILSVDPAVLMAATGSTNGLIRTAAYRLLALGDDPIAPGQLPVRPPPELVTERVMRFFFESSRGLERTESAQVLAPSIRDDTQIRKKAGEEPIYFVAHLGALSKEERILLLDANGTDKETRDNLAKAAFPKTERPQRPALMIRTFDGLPPEMARSIFEANGCEGAKDSFDSVQVQFGPGGRPIKVTPVRSTSSAPGCLRASLTLATSSLGMNGDDKSLLILPEDRRFLKCAASESFAWAGVKGIADADLDLRGRPSMGIKGITPAIWRIPSNTSSIDIGNKMRIDQTRRQLPVKPMLAEAGIAASGCVTSVRLLMGVEELVEAQKAILEVVSRDYTPATLRGDRIPATTVGLNQFINFTPVR